jgi:hypothetical protein
MDPDAVAPLLMGIVFVLTTGAVLILRGPLGRALADRIAGRVTPRDDQGLERVVRDVHDLRAELGEVQERLDFTERLLAQQREAGRLPGGQ